jgi:hypothetical protein
VKVQLVDSLRVSVYRQMEEMGQTRLIVFFLLLGAVLRFSLVRGSTTLVRRSRPRENFLSASTVSTILFGFYDFPWLSGLHFLVGNTLVYATQRVNEHDDCILFVLFVTSFLSIYPE